MLLSRTHHRLIYMAALSLVAVGLPLSKAFMSIGGIILAINFLIEGNLIGRITSLKSKPVILLLIGVFALHATGLIWSNDLSHGLSDLRIKLPLLFFPVVIGLSEPLKRKEFLMVIGLFTASVIFTSFLSTWEFMRIKDDPTADFRTISLFTSHIRYSLMVCIAYLVLLNLAWNEKNNLSARLAYIVLAAWLSCFVFILQSMTGIVIWLLCSYLLLIYTLAYIKEMRLRTVGLTVITLVPLLIGSYLVFQVDAFYPDQAPDFSQLESFTERGESYRHDTTNLTLENGEYINFYIAPHELEVEWNERSDISFWGGLDHSGQPINATLTRYLTSRGLRKDSAGVNALTETDIHAIESGIANVRFTYGNPIDSRIYTVIWEFDRMMNEKRVQGHSVTQRILFWKTGWKIFNENWLMGVGSGDVNQAFNEMYDRAGTKLGDPYRLRSHNQYLTMGVALGIPGLGIFLLSIFLPFFTLKNANSFLYFGFAIVLYCSMLNEDTLETQAGVTLYAMFNVLLLYGIPSLSSLDDSTDR